MEFYLRISFSRPGIVVVGVITYCINFAVCSLKQPFSWLFGLRILVRGFWKYM